MTTLNLNDYQELAKAAVQRREDGYADARVDMELAKQAATVKFQAAGAIATAHYNDTVLLVEQIYVADIIAIEYKLHNC